MFGEMAAVLVVYVMNKWCISRMSMAVGGLRGLCVHTHRHKSPVQPWESTKALQH